MILHACFVQLFSGLQANGGLPPQLSYPSAVVGGQAGEANGYVDKASPQRKQNQSIMRQRLKSISQPFGRKQLRIPFPEQHSPVAATAKFRQSVLSAGQWLCIL